MRPAPLLTCLLASTCLAVPQQGLEKLDRGVVAIPEAGGSVFVSWRLLGTEPKDIAFDVLRQSGDAAFQKINIAPLSGATCYVDPSADLGEDVRYKVVPAGGQADEALESPAFLIPGSTVALPYLTIPLQRPAGGQTPDGKDYTYTANDAAPADLDGDGSYEIILRWEPTNSYGGSWGVFTGPVLFDAYKLDGTRLWRINLGTNVVAGAHLVNFIAADFDGDGRAEFATKTSDGTIDGLGNVIGDANADHRCYTPTPGRHTYRVGFVYSGPEFVTVFDGRTGKALASAPYEPKRHPVVGDNPTPAQLNEIWGDSYGNRANRFLACAAVLDGQLPSLVFSRGYYTRTVLAAYDWRDGQLTQRWIFDSEDGTPKNKPFGGQGNHNLSVVDVDNDGKDEIIYGAMAVDDDGTGIYTTGFGHGDAQHVSDLDPEHPGLEAFGIQERFDDAGGRMFDARTGAVLWKLPSVKAGEDGEGPGRGLAADIDPRHPGTECWVAGAGIAGLYSAKGEKIADAAPRSCNFAIWWDGDLLRELCDRNRVMKWDYRTGELTNLLVAEGCVSNNGTKATPCLQADLFGDWREEVVWRTQDDSALRIFTTTIPTKQRFPTLMHDRQYRMSTVWQNAGYNQPPHPSFRIGE